MNPAFIDDNEPSYGPGPQADYGMGGPVGAEPMSPNMYPQQPEPYPPYQQPPYAQPPPNMYQHPYPPPSPNMYQQPPVSAPPYQQPSYPPPTQSA